MGKKMGKKMRSDVVEYADTALSVAEKMATMMEECKKYAGSAFGKMRVNLPTELVQAMIGIWRGLFKENSTPLHSSIYTKAILGGKVGESTVFPPQEKIIAELKKIHTWSGGGLYAKVRDTAKQAGFPILIAGKAFNATEAIPVPASKEVTPMKAKAKAKKVTK